MRALRLPLVLCLLVVPVLGGCLGSGGPDGMSPSPEVPSASNNSTAWTTIRCDFGPHDGLVQGSVDVCNDRIFDETWGPANEVDIAVDPNDPQHLVAGGKDYTVGREAGCDEYNVWNGVYTSHDGGRTWETMLMPGYPGDENETSLSTYNCNSDPVVDFLPDGTALFSGLPYSGAQPVAPGDERVLTDGAITMHRGEDHGRNWSDASYPAVSAATILDKQWFAVNPENGNIYLTFMHFGPGIQLRITRSTDGGESWSPAEIIVETPPRAIKQFATPAVGAGGTVYVTWLNLLDGTIYLSRNVEGSMAFTPGIPIQQVQVSGPPPNTEHRHLTYPVLATDPTRPGHLYVAWDSAADGDHDVYLMRSTDGGITWSDPVKVNDVDDGAQYMPWVDVGTDGQVHLVWYDRRDDPANTEMVPYYAHVDPDAWPDVDPNLRVGEALFHGDDGYHQTGVPFIGDYINVDGADGIAHLIWADTRHGRSEAYHAAILE